MKNKTIISNVVGKSFHYLMIFLREGGEPLEIRGLSLIQHYSILVLCYTKFKLKHFPLIKMKIDIKFWLDLK